MSLLTDHWSVSPPPDRIRAYHIEFAYTGALSPATLDALYAARNPQEVDWEMLLGAFTVYKNFDFSQALSYGTYHLNTDPRDGSPNIEIAMLGMDGAGVQVQGPWGLHPYLKAHAWVHAYLNACVAILKNLDVGASFDTSVEPSVLQNGPIYVLSTHAERAYQTNDDGQDKIPQYGYFIYSGDSDCRYDCAALDERDAHNLSDPASAIKSMHLSAAWLRAQSHAIKNTDPKNLLKLDKDPT